MQGIGVVGSTRAKSGLTSTQAKGENPTVPGRSKTFVGLGVFASVMLVMLVMLLGEDGDEQPKRATTQERARDLVRGEARNEHPPAQRPASGPERPPAPDQPPAAEQRDATGQLLSAGPAQVAQLPERPEGALDNVPNPEESLDATNQVLARLEAEIAQAEAAGDTATAARLEVRRARLERKQAEAEATAEPTEPD